MTDLASSIHLSIKKFEISAPSSVITASLVDDAVELDLQVVMYNGTHQRSTDEAKAPHHSLAVFVACLFSVREKNAEQ